MIRSTHDHGSFPHGQKARQFAWAPIVNLLRREKIRTVQVRSGHHTQAYGPFWRKAARSYTRLSGSRCSEAYGVYLKVKRTAIAASLCHRRHQKLARHMRRSCIRKSPLMHVRACCAHCIRPCTAHGYIAISPDPCMVMKVEPRQSCVQAIRSEI